MNLMERMIVTLAGALTNWIRFLAATLLLPAIALPACTDRGIDRDADLGRQLANFVAPFVENRDFEGVVLIRRAGVPDVVGAFAFDDTAPEFTADIPFPIGSISKTFTAAAIQRLSELGQLELSDAITGVVPELASQDITIQHLLRHTSGVPDYHVLEAFQSVRAAPMPLEQFASWIGAYPLDFEPGATSNYSNSGYNLLALIVERVSGQKLAGFLSAEVFAPLGMTSAGTAVNTFPSGVPGGRTPTPAPEFLGAPAALHPSWLLGSGSAYASARDLVHWGEEIARRVAEGWLPFGWGVRGEGNRRYLSQNGRIPGYAATLEVHPAEGLSVVVLSRVESDAVTRIAAGAVALALGTEVASEERRVEVALESTVLASYRGVYDFAPGFQLTAAPHAGGLGIAVGEGEGLQFGFLQPLGNDKFFFREAYVKVDFERNERGVVTGILWAGSGPYPRRVPLH